MSFPIMFVKIDQNLQSPYPSDVLKENGVLTEWFGFWSYVLAHADVESRKGCWIISFICVEVAS